MVSLSMRESFSIKNKPTTEPHNKLNAEPHNKPTAEPHNDLISSVYFSFSEIVENEGQREDIKCSSN